MWIAFIITGLIFFIYGTAKDKSDNTRERVTQFGGMRKKYSLLAQFMEAGDAHIIKQNKDTLIFATKNGRWSLDYIGSNLEIRHLAVMPYLGNVSKRWSYPDGFPQEVIIKELVDYSQWLFAQMSEAADRHSKTI